MQTPLYYIGTPDEVAHHARPLDEAFDLRIVGAEDAVRLARPGEVCVFFNEYFPRFRDACLELKSKGCATLYAVDGILEWRNSWELPEHGTCCLWVMRPVLSHKVACIGRSQARVLESWGNLGRCEVVGVPRFDVLANRQPRQRKPDEPLRVLIVTAKCPGFNPEQVARTTRSLVDLKRWFDGHPRLGTTRLEPVWRITQGLETTVGVRNQLDDTTGADLASVLKTVDVMITTPSTAMLEGMRQGVPVAILDYHNRPHYVPAAWRITAGDQLDEVLPELLNPSPARMLYQDSLLHDALECHSAATPRLVELIETMHGIAKDCIARGEPLEFPRRILHDQQDGHHVDDAYDHGRLYPSRLMFTGSGRKLLPLEAIALARREGFSVPVAVHADTPEAESLAAAEEFLASFQQCRREWRDVSDELSAQWQRAKQRATSRLRSELQQARRELALWQRRSIKARLKRLSYKIRRLLRLTPPPARQTDDRRRQAA